MTAPSKRADLTGLRFSYLWRDIANMALTEPDSKPGFRKCFFIYRPIFWLWRAPSKLRSPHPPLRGTLSQWERDNIRCKYLTSILLLPWGEGGPKARMRGSITCLLPLSFHYEENRFRETFAAQPNIR